jgi:membrane protein
MLSRLGIFFKICSRSFRLLRRTEPLVLSSSTAFFATFSLSPILILLVNFFGLYFKSDSIANQLFGKLGSAIGPEAADEIQSIVNNFMEFETNWMLTTAGVLFFLFIATTLLNVIKMNIHKLWRIRKTKRTFRYVLRERMTLVGIILVTGSLFLISTMIDSALAISLDYLQTIIPRFGIIVIRFFNIIFSTIVVTLWFTTIFKFLPQARIKWDVAFNGAFLTAILFNLGKMALGKILIHARIASIFGASASFALLLLFIFYCSFILYYGAAFAHEYAEYSGKHISAGKHALEYEEKLIEAGRIKSIQAPRA